MPGRPQVEHLPGRVRFRIVPLDNFGENSVKIVLLTPVGKMGSKLGEIGNIADVIPNPVGFLEAVLQIETHILQSFNCFQDRQTVRPAASEVIGLPEAGLLIEFEKQGSDVVAMNLVANLFPLIAKNRVFLTFDSARNNIR